MKLQFVASILLSTVLTAMTRRQSVLDNGLAPTIVEHVQRETQYAPQCEIVGKPLNLLIILDSSGSLKEEFENERRVVEDITKTVVIRPDYTRMALIQYSGIARTEFDFNTFVSRNHKINERNVLKAVKQLRFINGVTKTGNALQHALRELKPEKGWRPDVRTIVFLVSDGRSYDHPRNLDELAAANLRKRGVDLYAWGTGQWVAIEELIDITGDPGKVFTNSSLVKDQRDINDLKEFFGDYRGDEVCQDVPVCVPGSDKPADVLFVVDGSGSLKRRFDEEIRFLHQVIMHANIHPEAVRVAVMQYANRPRMEFSFMEHQSREAVEEALDRIAYMSGTTNTKEALEFAVRQMRSAPGRRPDVPIIVVVLTDGHAKRRVGSSADKLIRAADYVYGVAVNNEKLVDGEELFHITKEWRSVYMKTNLTEFVNILDQHFSFNCPGMEVAGEENFEPVPRSPVSVTCSRDRVTLDIRTLKAFEGRLYALKHYDESGCYTLGRGKSNTVRLQLHAGRCGIVRTPTEDGYAFKGAVMLQFHPDAVTKVDQMLDLRCFHRDRSARSKVGLLSSKMPQQCHYRLRKLAPNGCVALEARVGESLFHTWECDSDPSQYGFLVHDCTLEGNEGGRIRVSDGKGCPMDESLFSVPRYTNNSKAVMEIPSFRLPKSSYLRFKCKISVCDKAAGKCDFVVPPACTNKRAKRATKFAGMPTFDVATRWITVLDSEVVTPSEPLHYCNGYAAS